MVWRRVYSGSSGEENVGYCRAIILPHSDGDWIHVSGTTGYDYRAGLISHDAEDQTRQALRNLEVALQEAGAGWDDVYFYRAYVRDAQVWSVAAPVLAERFRAGRPASTAVIAPAMDPAILVEIEIDAHTGPPTVDQRDRTTATR